MRTNRHHSLTMRLWLALLFGAMAIPAHVMACDTDTRGVHSAMQSHRHPAHNCCATKPVCACPAPDGTDPSALNHFAQAGCACAASVPAPTVPAPKAAKIGVQVAVALSSLRLLISLLSVQAAAYVPVALASVPQYRFVSASPPRAPPV